MPHCECVGRVGRVEGVGRPEQGLWGCPFLPRSRGTKAWEPEQGSPRVLRVESYELETCKEANIRPESRNTSVLLPLDNRTFADERRESAAAVTSQISAERPAPYARCRCWAKKRRVSSTSKSLCTLCTALGDMGRSQRNSRPPKMVTEATFDVEARKDWLQGFRKRKRERRLTGLAHGALKARKQKLADRAARRSMRPPPAPEPVVLDEAPATRETVVLTDSNVVEQWGAAVTVTTTVGGLDVDGERWPTSARSRPKGSAARRASATRTLISRAAAAARRARYWMVRRRSAAASVKSSCLTSHFLGRWLYRRSVVAAAPRRRPAAAPLSKPRRRRTHTQPRRCPPRASPRMPASRRRRTGAPRPIAGTGRTEAS
jgi:hypothetical protein